MNLRKPPFDEPNRFKHAQRSETNFSVYSACISLLTVTMYACVRMILTIQIDWFPKQHYPIGLSDGHRVCSLWGGNWFCTVHTL